VLRPAPIYETLPPGSDAVLSAAADRTGHLARAITGFLDVPLASARQRLQRLQPARLWPTAASNGHFQTTIAGRNRGRGVDYAIVHGALFKPDDYRELIAAMDQRLDLRYRPYPLGGGRTRM
jgi:hypothetical protein